MGVYGNIHGAFNDLGKPSIKLEFEDNESLVAFSKKMQEPDGRNDDPDGGNFTPSTYTQEQLDNAVKNQTVTGWGIFPEIPDGWQLVKTSAAPKGFNVITKGEPSFKMTTEGWRFKHSLDAALIEKKKGFVDGTKNSLEGYGDTYIVTDLRKRAKKEPGDTKAYNKAFDWKLEDRPGVAIKNFNKDLYELTKGLKWSSDKETAVKDTNYKYVTLYRNSNGSGYDMSVPIFMPSTFNRSKNTFTGYYIDRNIPVDINQLQHYTIDSNGYPNGYFTKDYFKKVFNNALQNEIALLKEYKDNPNYTKERQKELNKRYNYFLQFYTDPEIYTPDITGGGILRRYAVEYADINSDSLGEPGDTYIITDTRKKPRKNLEDTAALQKYDIRKFSGEELQKMQTDDPLLYEQIKSDINTPATTVNDTDNGKVVDGKTPIHRVYDYVKRKYPNAIVFLKVNTPFGEQYYVYGKDALTLISLFDLRSVTTRNGDKLVGILASDKEKYLAKLAKSGYRVVFADYLQGNILGKTANNTLYNNLDILDYRGMQPTYRQLPNYDAFFKPAANKNSLKGWGLNDTKKLIADICRNHYKECAAIAKHLKAETKLQSAFNLWHWLHHNIRYEYDREGREEVRTPARVWADRHRGVDCDCLSVLAWCVLKCMGYNPAFELAAFRNKPAYSHIYINLDGIVVDRVWYVFNSRPPFITKTELFKVGMLDNFGQLF